MRERITELMVTFFYIGKSKYCPGTIASLATFPLSYMIASYTIKSKVVFFAFLDVDFIPRELISVSIVLLFASMILFFVGVYCSSQYLLSSKLDDPQEIVIDEVAGQMLVITLCLFSVIFVQNSTFTTLIEINKINFVYLFLMPLTLFRFFDIIKPWPIDWIDQNVKGAFGVMIDDVIAAVFASVVHYAMVFTIMDLLK